MMQAPGGLEALREYERRVPIPDLQENTEKVNRIAENLLQVGGATLVGVVIGSIIGSITANPFIGFAAGSGTYAFQRMLAGRIDSESKQKILPQLSLRRN